MSKVTRDRFASMNIQYRYYPLARFLDDTVRYGFQNVELWGGAPHFYSEGMTYRQVAQTRREIESRGLRLICYTPEQCVYPINLASNAPDTRRRSQKFFENSIRAAGELGAGKVLVTSGTGYFDGSNREEAWKWAGEGLYALGEMAADYGITLALEVLRTDESNLVHDLPSLLKMLGELNHSSIGGMIDTIPMALAGERPAHYLEALGDRLVHIHFIDGAPRGHLAWGDGVLDKEGYLEELDAYPYKGYLSLEITDGRYFMDPSDSAKRSVERLFSVIKS